jgi:hypothetical protein
MLTETLLRISFSVFDHYSLVPTSHWLQGNAQELVTGGFRFDFPESQAASIFR